MITGDEIRRLRKEKRWTQQDLADRVGVAKTTVLDWEKNRYFPEGKNVKNLALALGVSVAYLMGETDNPSPAQPQKKQPLEEGAAESITLPSGRVVKVTADQAVEYREWQRNRTTQSTIAIAAILGIPMSDLVPAEDVAEYPTAKHKELAAILEIMAQNDPTHGILPRGVSRLQNIPENDVKYILEAIKQTARWKMEQVMDEEKG